MIFSLMYYPSFSPYAYIIKDFIDVDIMGKFYMSPQSILEGKLLISFLAYEKISSWEFPFLGKLPSWIFKGVSLKLGEFWDNKILLPFLIDSIKFVGYRNSCVKHFYSLLMSSMKKFLLYFSSLENFPTDDLSGFRIYTWGEMQGVYPFSPSKFLSFHAYIFYKERDIWKYLLK